MTNDQRRKTPITYNILKAISILFCILILSFGVWFVRAVRHYTVPILMYHYINAEESRRSKLGVSPKAFQRQMSFLRRHKYNIVALETLVDLIKEKKKIPPKTVVITFDDGYLDNYTNAFPILKKYNIPATIFVVVDRIGKRLGNDDYMSQENIEELLMSGIISIGSHSVSHPNLSEIESESKLRYEISGSKKILEKALNTKVDFFSYPFGSLAAKARDFVIEAGYKGAVGTNFPKDYPAGDIYALKRLRISENCNNMFIFWVETSGLYTYIKEHRDEY